MVEARICESWSLVYIMCEAFSETEVKAHMFNYGTREHIVWARVAETILWIPLISALFLRYVLDPPSVQSKPESQFAIISLLYP